MMGDLKERRCDVWLGNRIEEVTLQVPDNYMSQIVVDEIFEQGHYDSVLESAGVKQIVDIGAHIGAAALYFAAMYPKATVECWEPDPQAFQVLMTNTAKHERIFVRRFALGDRNGQFRLRTGRIDPCLSSLQESYLADGAEVVVEVRAAAEQLEHLKEIDILKIDVEGCEVSILDSLQDKLPFVKVLYLEYHDDEDRRRFDGILVDHVLVKAIVRQAHRGVVTYLHKRLVPLQWERLRIKHVWREVSGG